MFGQSGVVEPFGRDLYSVSLGTGPPYAYHTFLYTLFSRLFRMPYKNYRIFYLLKKLGNYVQKLFRETKLFDTSYFMVLLHVISIYSFATIGASLNKFLIY